MMKNREFKWIFIQEKEKSKSGKTKIFSVMEKKDGEEIGIIKWYSAWRKYAFFPCKETCYEEDCLEDIASFLKELKEKI